MATIRECNRALKQLPAFAREEAQRTMDTTAFQVAREAARRAPKASGDLKKAIDWKSRPRSVSAVVGISDPAVFYWKYLEYGTVKMGARPFMRPAAEGMAADHDRRMVQGLQRALTQMAREAR